LDEVLFVGGEVAGQVITGFLGGKEAFGEFIVD